MYVHSPLHTEERQSHTGYKEEGSGILKCVVDRYACHEGWTGKIVNMRMRKRNTRYNVTEVCGGSEDMTCVERKV